MTEDNTEKNGRPIDWSEIRSRLEKARSILDSSLRPDFEEERSVLHARAVALARAESPAAAEGAHLEVLEFRLSDEAYAVETMYVREVVPLRDLTPLPCVPSFVLGIINLRGQILSVVDLKEFFGLPARGLTDLNKVIVLESPDMEFGLLADAIAGVRVLAAAELEPAIPTLAGVGAGYVNGVTRDRLIVLAADNILSDPKMTIREKVE